MIIGEQGRGPAAPVKHTVTRRPSPWRSCGGNGAARKPASPTITATMNTGSPSWPVTQVSPVAGAGNFSRAMCIFCTLRVP